MKITVPSMARARTIVRKILGDLASMSNDTVDDGGIFAACLYEALENRHRLDDCGGHETDGAWLACASCQAAHAAFLSIVREAEHAFAADPVVVNAMAQHFREAIERSAN
jgi:hypothetical protein